MTNFDPLKSELPFPYNEELSGVLRSLNRRRKEARARLANDPTTAAYVVAGMRLLERELGPRDARTHSRQADHPLLAVLSQRAVVAEVANNPNPFPKRGTAASLRDRWASQSDFIADILRFGLWSRHYIGAYGDEIAAAAARLVSGSDFARAIQDVAYWDLTSFLAAPTTRLQFLATAAGNGDPTIGEALSENYRDIKEEWQPIHEATIKARGLALRSPITLDDIAYILAALVEGFALRSMADATAQIVDDEKRTSLYATAVLGLIASCLRRVDDADERTVDEIVNAS